MRRADRGAAAVEFAFVAPILIMLLFGIISYGYLLSFRQSISQAAAEGARAAATAPANADHEQIAFTAVEDVLDAACPAGDSDYLSCAATIGAACSDCLEVTVTWNYAADGSKPKLFYDFALPDTLSYTSVARITQPTSP
ncbi:TadE/TadG family type IV pilus assembly protein [Nocardioides sp. SYSU DS0663]|uniref:TadE/TadG family type IV pilus assembly protein n=1 Tax=Nocardioides sp. SYSU DS0663 TaxID=3416445 RepID=UPI003F4BF2F4